MSGMRHTYWPWEVCVSHPAIAGRAQEEHRMPPLGAEASRDLLHGKDQASAGNFALFSTQRSECCDQHRNQAQVLLRLVDLQAYV